jgi:hypothetical protein
MVRIASADVEMRGMLQGHVAPNVRATDHDAARQRRATYAVTSGCLPPFCTASRLARDYSLIDLKINNMPDFASKLHTY